MTPAPLLRVQGLAVDFIDAGSSVAAVRALDFELARGARLALLGESGCGKTVSMMAVAGLLPDNARVRGTIEWPGEVEPPRLGRDIGMVFQDPMSSLNPVLRIGEQIAEVAQAHLGHDEEQAWAHAAGLLVQVGIERPQERLQAFPHELSGGQRQRVAIAMAIAASPRLLIADEPTTALDTVVQAQIVALIDRLMRERGMALLLVTHDIALARSIAPQGVVMRAGEALESGAMDELVQRPRHAEVRALIAATLDLDRPPAVSPAMKDAATLSTTLAEVGSDGAAANGRPPLLLARGLSKSLGRGDARRPVLRGVDLDLRAGETLAVVGGSGAGKTTLARVLMRLVEPDAGTVAFEGADLLALQGEDLRRARQRFQMVFQDPLGALNPRATIGRLLADPLRLHGQPCDDAAVAALLARVGLAAALAARRPHEISGGQRQRVNIARALASGPRLLVLDEPVSSLDVSVRAQILDLLQRIRQETGIACLFISHGLAVVRAVADRVIVMDGGEIVESGPVAEVLSAPRHAVPRALLAAAPRLAAPPLYLSSPVESGAPA